MLYAKHPPPTETGTGIDNISQVTEKFTDVLGTKILAKQMLIMVSTPEINFHPKCII